MQSSRRYRLTIHIDHNRCLPIPSRAKPYRSILRRGHYCWQRHPLWDAAATALFAFAASSDDLALADMICRADETFLLHALDERSRTVVADA